MSTTQKKGRRRALFAAALVIAGAGLVAGSTATVHADQTGASASKTCPQTKVGGEPFTIGDTITCVGSFANTGETPATIISLTDQAPWISFVSPNNGPFVPITCTTVPGGVLKQAGSTLNPGEPCVGSFQIQIPNDPRLCNTIFRDRAAVEFEYPAFNPPLSSDAGATATVPIVCRPSITVTKTADELSKPTDPVHYSVTICNSGLITVTRNTVSDSLIGDIAANFGSTLVPGACETYAYDRTALASDPDPVVNTVTASYSAGVQQATANASASTNLFYPAVDVSKVCGPLLNEVGGVSNCTIVVTNNSSADSPALINGTILDTLSGDLLAAGNPDVVTNDCSPVLLTGGVCTITTARTILASDPNPVVNTVTVHYNPDGFPNDIGDSASAEVATVSPAITILKTADASGKVTDPVHYTVQICNAGVFSVNRVSVSDTLVADPTFPDLFNASLAPGECTPVVGYDRVVEAGDPDPLVNTVTAVYGNAAGVSATASASATTNLFQPSLTVSKNCAPDPIAVGEVETCTIVVTNTSSADAPPLEVATISDSLSGDLLLAGNPAVASNTCDDGALATNGSTCTIVTNRTVLITDVSPIVNVVNVLYHPAGFPNDITGSATDSVTIRPSGTGCTPGFWKQPNHFSSWVGYTPNQTWTSVFGLPAITIGSGSKAITNPTLLQALSANGGGVNQFARFAVNALLNASSTTQPDFTVAQVQALVDDALTPGGLTMDQVTALFVSAPGVTTDNCRLVRP